MPIGKIEDRKHKRFKTDLPAALRGVGSFAWMSGSVLNLSATGLCLYCRSSIENQQLLEIEVSTVDREGAQQKRRIAGRVVWRRGNRYGVMFTGGDPRRAIKRSAGRR